MPPYQALLFWMGGVLIDPLTELTLSALKPGLLGHERILYKHAIDPLALDLNLGRINTQEFSLEVFRACSPDFSAQELEARIPARTRLRNEVLEVIRKIPAGFEKWLISDFPQDWLGKLAELPIILEIFTRDRIIFTGELGLQRFEHEIFQALPEAVHHKIEDCLVVDAVSKRAVESIKHGLVSIIYVYPGRLAHELALHNIIEGRADVMHPSSSERVELL
jgi:FMN phosphatase YigB (HAD superfamily)